MSNTTFTVKDDKKTLVIVRTFNAEPAKVWAAWSQPELFVQWWGPTGWTTTTKHFDFSEGGYNHYGMKCEDPAQKDWYGQTTWGKMTFKNIKPEMSFGYVDAFCDENAIVTPGMPLSDTFQEFIAEDGKTKVVSTTIFEKAEDLEQVIAMGMQEGLEQTWDRLEDLVSKA